MTTNAGVLTLAEVLPAAAAALAPVTDSDPPVHIDYPDALDPPALVVIWDDPWLEEPRQLGGCVFPGHVAVICVAGRVEPGAGVDTLQELVAGTAARLAAHGAGFTFAGAGGPREFMVGGVNYLGARLAYRIPTAI